MGRDVVRLGGAALRRGLGAAARPPVPAGQRPLARAERHPLRPLRRLVEGDPALARGRRPRAAAAAADAGLPQQDDRGDAAALPGARRRAGRRVRAARRGRADLGVRRALLRPHHLRAARPARGPLAAGRALGRRPRQGVRHGDRGRPAADRGGARRALRVRRRGDRVATGARPADDLVSTLVAAQEADGLSREELGVSLVFLAMAGMETTRNQIGLAVQTLLRHPAQWACWARGPTSARRRWRR